MEIEEVAGIMEVAVKIIRVVNKTTQQRTLGGKLLEIRIYPLMGLASVTGNLGKAVLYVWNQLPALGGSSLNPNLIIDGLTSSAIKKVTERFTACYTTVQNQKYR